MSILADFLKTVSLFKNMSVLELEAVEGFLQIRQFSEGETIFRQGDKGNEMFIVRTGLIESVVEDLDGKSRPVYQFGPGRFFGEMSIIEGEPRSANCTAKVDSELLALDALNFYHLVWEHPMLGVNMLSSMARVMAGWLEEASGFLDDTVRWGETARKRAIIDELTGLFNRRFLMETMEARFFQSKGSAPECAAIMLDLDNFRLHNERFGMAAGDAILATAGAAFGNILKDGDVAAHLAGDEFAFFMPDASLDEALATAEKIRTIAEELFLEFKAGSNGEKIRVQLSASLGLAISPADATDAATLLDMADRALLKAKEGGRNRVAVYNRN